MEYIHGTGKVICTKEMLGQSSIQLRFYEYLSYTIYYSSLQFVASILILVVRRPRGLSDGEAQSLAQGGRHGVTDLPVLLDGGPVELVVVREALAPGTLSDRHNPEINVISRSVIFTKKK